MWYTSQEAHGQCQLVPPAESAQRTRPVTVIGSIQGHQPGLRARAAGRGARERRLKCDLRSGCRPTRPYAGSAIREICWNHSKSPVMLTPANIKPASARAASSPTPSCRHCADSPCRKRRVFRTSQAKAIAAAVMTKTAVDTVSSERSRASLIVCTASKSRRDTGHRPSNAIMSRIAASNIQAFAPHI
jgi:hypothetical protein